MAGASTGPRWIAGLAGIAAAALVAGWLLAAGPGPQRGEGEGDVSSAEAGAGAPGEPALRIAPGGRARLDAATLPEQGMLAVALDLEDEARGAGAHAVRLVSEDGRRAELMASPRPGAGSGLRLEVDAAFFAPGRYLIEVDTAEDHPLRIRRYVLEVR